MTRKVHHGSCANSKLRPNYHPCRGGEIGRRTGLKILSSARGVPVRFRSSAPLKNFSKVTPNKQHGLSRSFDRNRSQESVRVGMHLSAFRRDVERTTTLVIQDTSFLNYRVPERTASARGWVRALAGLGGFLARKTDGDPGPFILWRAHLRLQDIMLGMSLASA